MTKVDRKNALKIYLKSFLLKIIGFILITIALLNVKENIWLVFNWQMVVHIIGTFLIVTTFLFEFISFFWINSKISDFKERWQEKINNDPGNNYYVISVICSFLSFVFPLALINTAKRIWDIKINLTERRFNKNKLWVEKRYQNINNKILALSLKKEIKYWMFLLIFVILSSLTIFLLDNFVFNNNSPILFIALIASAFLVSSIILFIFYWKWQKERKQIYFYMVNHKIIVENNLEEILKKYFLYIKVGRASMISSLFLSSNKPTRNWGIFTPSIPILVYILCPIKLLFDIKKAEKNL